MPSGPHALLTFKEPNISAISDSKMFISAISVFVLFSKNGSSVLLSSTDEIVQK